MARSDAGRSRQRRRRGIARLRSAYFAQAGAVAQRHAVEFEDILRHLWRARRLRGRIPLRSVRYVDDLAHAVACRTGDGAAWEALADRHESHLVRRAAERVGEVRAILIVRRAFAELRRDDGPDGFAGYLGDRPLGTWLGRHVLDRLHRRQAGWCTPRNGAAPSGGHWSAQDPAAHGDISPTVLPFPFPGAAIE